MIVVVNLFLLSLLLLNGYVYKKISGTSINPVTIMSYFWFFAAVFPIVFLLEAEISPITMLYIFGFIFCFSIPFYVHSLQPIKLNQYFLSSEICRNNNLLLFYFVVGLISFSIHLQLNQLSYLEYLKSPLDITAQNVAKKYAEDLNYSVFSQISIILMYPTAFLAGLFYIFNDRSKKNILIVYSFVVPVLFFLIFGDKGALFSVLFLFVAGITLARKMENEKSLVKKEWGAKVIFIFFILLLLIIVAFTSRAGDVNNDDLNSFLIFNIRSYSLGHLHAFNDWLFFYNKNPSIYQYEVLEKPFGFYTFKAVYDLINIDIPTPMGTYDEYFNNTYLETNIYTVFRGLIYDFGILGSYLIAFLFGLVVRYGGVINYKYKKLTTITTWFVFFTVLYSSYLVSAFVWKTTIASIMIIALSFLVIESKGIRKL